MARNREFDYAASLERATDAFWGGGYAGTPLRDLLSQMGIGEGSFYNTLKSKKNAFLECLKYYNATVNRRRGELLMAAPTAALGVRALFRSVLDCLDDPKTPSRICLMAGSITPEVLVDADLRKYVEQQLSLFAEIVAARIMADKEAGLLPATLNASLVVPIVATYLQGLWRMALVSYDRPQFEQQIEAFLTGLGL
jgi:TetR/AcrR family transcriptional repressor of nem operon